tara:strand:- start:10 stop:900 length:891 start_codon:yes stop_codon:yes gene_type:complete
MHEENNIPNTHDPGQPEYFDEISKKKKKSQPINFENTIWETLDQKPRIRNLYFMDSLLFSSCKFKAEKELGYSQNEESVKEREDRIVELYEEEDGDIEKFNRSNYLTATKEQIHQITFRDRMYRIEVQIITMETKFFQTGSPFIGPIMYQQSRTYRTTGRSFPVFTESHERMAGQRHSGRVNIDTTRIMRQQNGTYLIKVTVVGNGFTTSGFGFPVGIIPFASDSIPILFINANPSETPLYAFGSIIPVNSNSDGEAVEDVYNWSLSEELKKHKDGDIPLNELSMLAQETLNSIAE